MGILRAAATCFALVSGAVYLALLLLYALLPLLLGRGSTTTAVPPCTSDPS